MRHQKKGFKLNRTAAHRKATLAALSNALIRHKRITTTWTKARALRMYVEPIINRAKEDTTHNRRQVFRHLQDKESVTELFGDVATHIGERPGGYTRIIKLGQRAGDSAEMAMIELVDYNDVRPDSGSTGKKRKTRRAGRKTSAPVSAAPVVEEVVEEAVTEEVAEEATTEEAVEEATAEDVAEEATTEEAVEEATTEDVAEEDAAEKARVDGDSAEEAKDEPDDEEKK